MRLVAPVLAAALWAGAGLADPFVIAEARYDAPTERYPHGALGDPLEWGALVLRAENGREIRLTLPDSRVFEDVAPRLADVDLDGEPEAITVESDAQFGARLAIYDDEGLFAATPFIGTRFRWLAPVAAADLDGDGTVELAYVDRPHLAKVLRVWRFVDGELKPVAEAPGLTNHRYGLDVIEGGVRDCGNGLELLTADAAWRRIVATRLEGGQLLHRDIGGYTPEMLEEALSC